MRAARDVRTLSRSAPLIAIIPAARHSARTFVHPSSAAMPRFGEVVAWSGSARACTSLTDEHE
jgi:hypothetical protein